MFKNPFSFKGRIRRREYALSLLIFAVVFILISSLSGSLEDPSLWPFVFVLPAVWFLIAQRTKRCHDRGVSGIWQLIPFYGWILLFADGDPGENEYGPNLKGIEYTDDWDPFKNEETDKN